MVCQGSNKTITTDIEDYGEPTQIQIKSKEEIVEAEQDLPQQCDIYDDDDVIELNESDNSCTSIEATSNPTSSDLAQKYGDNFMLEKDTVNPYMSFNKEHQMGMNRTTAPDEIVKPFSKDLDESKLRLYVKEVLQADPQSKEEFEDACKASRKSFKMTFKKTELLYGYRLLCRDEGITPSDLFKGFVQSKAYRSQSGVMVYAAFTHPFWKDPTNKGTSKSFSCKYDCSYCPEMPGQPRSYVPGEPGLDRANGVDYDTVKQVHTRANSYNITGHVNDKAEVIVLGGTWHSYPMDYRRTFIRDLYYAFNTMHNDRDRPMFTMQEEITMNQNSKCRVIGLTIETRPDQFANVEEIRELRRMGVTRIQLGIQHTNDRMLTRIHRQCSSKVAINAIKTLKDCNFKVDIHLMPDLPKPFTKEFELKNKLKMNSKNLTYTKEDIDWEFDSLAEDYLMLETAFHSSAYAPDQVKIYPCEVMPWTKIKEDFERGIHVPYGGISENQTTNDLIDMLMNVKQNIPEHIRINRLIRDIPESYVLGGINDTSGRARVEKLMKEKGMSCKCIRCREVKKIKVDPETAVFRYHEYEASDGNELFLQYCTPDDKIIGFLRLRLSKNTGLMIHTKNDGSVKETNVFQELNNAAMIRELHVYGEAVRVNRKTTNVNMNTDTSRSHQHAGFGTKLLHKAFEFARERGYEKISVIPGEGVKAYYRRFGFTDGEYFLIKKLLPVEREEMSHDDKVDSFIPTERKEKNFDKVSSTSIVFYSELLVVLCLIGSIGYSFTRSKRL